MLPESSAAISQPSTQGNVDSVFREDYLEEVLRGYLRQLASDRITPNDLAGHLADWFLKLAPGEPALSEAEKRMAGVLSANTVTIWALGSEVQGVADDCTFNVLMEDLVERHGKDAKRFCLAPLLWQWTRTWPLTGTPDRRPRGILPAPFAARTLRRMEELTLPGLEPNPSLGPTQTNVRTPEMAYLPGLELDAHPTPALILALFDHGGGDSLAANGPAKPAVRIFIEAILDVNASARDGQVRQVPYLVREIAGHWLCWNLRHYRRKTLAPGGGLRKALDEVHHIVVPVGSRGGWYRPISVVALTGESLDDKVFISAVLPASRVGPPIDRRILRELGRRAGLAYRAYLSLVFEWDHYGGHNGKLVLPYQPEVKRNSEGMITGKTGEVLLNQQGRPIKSVHDRRAVPTGRREPSPWRTRYPEYSVDDLVRLAYPVRKLQGIDLRNARRRAKDAFGLIRNLGGCVIEELGEGRSRTFRVMPPDHSCNIKKI